MGYQYITKYDCPNYGGFGVKNKPKYIVIHHWGAMGQTFEGVINWFCYGTRATSAHYVVEAGRVACIVDCAQPAWHAGNGWYNTHSIGIECRPEMSQGDLDTLIELVANLFKTYGNLPVIGHRDIVATACPGRYYSKLDYIRKKAIELNKGVKVPTTTKPPQPKPVKVPPIKIDGEWGYYTTLQTQKKLKVPYRDGIISNQYKPNKDTVLLNCYDSGWDWVDYVSPYGSSTAKAIQKLVGATVDGVIGKGTVVKLQKFLGVAADGIMGTNTIKAWQKYITK